jgi:hypothetical protein
LGTFVATKVPRISWRSQRRNAFLMTYEAQLKSALPFKILLLIEASNERKGPKGQSVGFIGTDAHQAQVDQLPWPDCGSEGGFRAA